MADPQISVMIADAQPVFRRGLRHVLEADPTLNVVGEAADGEGAIALAQQLHPDILLLNQRLPKTTASEIMEQLTAIAPTTKMLLMTDGIERRDLLRALHYGVRGAIDKNAEEPVFLKAIRCVHKGEIWVERDILTEWAQSRVRTSETSVRLTARERDIIREILSGSSNRSMAEKFSISQHTVKRHLTNIFDKTGCSSRLELSLFALHHNLLA